MAKAITNASTKTSAVKATAKTSAVKAEQLRIAREQAARIKAEREAAEREAAATAKAREAAVEAHAKAVQSEALHANIEDLMAGIELPSWKRVVCGVLLGIAAASFVGYGVAVVMSYAFAAIVALAAGPALALALNALVWLVGIVTTWKAGGYVAGKVFSSVVLPEGLASRSFASISNAASNAKHSVGGFFAPRVDAAKHVFTGAFTKPEAV